MRPVLTSNGSGRRSRLPAVTGDVIAKVQNAFAPQTGAQRRQAAMEDEDVLRTARGARHPSLRH